MGWIDIPMRCIKVEQLRPEEGAFSYKADFLSTGDSLEDVTLQLTTVKPLYTPGYIYQMKLELPEEE